MATPKAPAGGFKQGGWYDGMQYWNGTFSAPGQIHAESDQKGAGQMVSKEVVSQTNPNNVAYLESRGAKLPSSSDQVSPYLNDYQSKLFEASQAPQVRTKSMTELKSELAPAGGPPALISRVDETARLRGEMGVATLEQQVNDLKAQEEEVVAQRRQRTQGEIDKPVAMNVISGRVSEVERQENERLDAIGRQKSRAIDNLNTSYNIINQYVQNLGLDYGDAVQRYDSEFNKNLQVYDIVMKQESEARAEAREERKIASANLATMMNLVTSGNLSYDNMPSDQKLMINKLEVQSGMPLGTMSQLKMSAKDSIVSHSTNDGVTSVVTVDGNGNLQLQQIGVRNSGGGTTLTKSDAKSAVKDARSILGEIDQQYRTKGTKASKVEDKDAWGGDKKLSVQEYQVAVEKLMTKSGLDFSTADEYLTNEMNSLGYSRWGQW